MMPEFPLMLERMPLFLTEIVPILFQSMPQLAYKNLGQVGFQENGRLKWNLI
jgi:hypothetical protein